MKKSILIMGLCVSPLPSLCAEEANNTDTKTVENYMQRLQKESELRMGPGLFSVPASENQAQWDTIWSFRLLHQSSETIEAEAEFIRSLIHAKNDALITQYSRYLKLRAFDEMRFSQKNIDERLKLVRERKDDKGISHYEGCLELIKVWLEANNPNSIIESKAEQAGIGQPATRPDWKSEGSDKTQPESEGRSR